MGLLAEIGEDWRFYTCAEAGAGRFTPLRSPGFWLIAVHRLGRRALRIRVPVIGKLARGICALLRFFLSILFGVNIRVGAQIGRRFHIHSIFGILITNGVVIGDDCQINSGVCIVHSANSRGSGTAVIGNRVRLGVGSKVLGGVKIGDFVIVGANAVVTHDVPSYHAAVGVPARHRPVPKEFVDEYYDPNYAPRRAGLLPPLPEDRPS